LALDQNGNRFGKMTEADLVAWFKQWTRAELEAALGELARDPAPT
jgi:hypothetical protein